MSAAKIVALTRKSNTINTLFIRKNIVEVRKFKKLMIFKIVFQESKKKLKSNEFESRISQLQRFSNARNSK